MISLMPQGFTLTTLPGNWPEFVRATADGCRQIYGPRFAEAYASRMTQALEATLARGAMLAWGAGSAQVCEGMCLATLRGEAGIVTWLHVLEPNWGRGVEVALVETAVEALSDRGCRMILIDAVPLFPAELANALVGRGFTRRAREVMVAPARALGCEEAEFHRPVTPKLVCEAAAVLTAAYARHPGRAMLPEVQSEAEADEYLAELANGAFGGVFPGHVQTAFDGREMAGFAAGAAAGGDVAYLFHVAVAPRYQGRGIGGRLVRSFAAGAAAARFARVALAVNADNRARRLYNRLGFETTCTVDVFWRHEESRREA